MSPAEIGAQCESRVLRAAGASTQCESQLSQGAAAPNSEELWAWESLGAPPTRWRRRFLPVSRSISRATCDGRTTTSTEFLESTVHDLEDVCDDDDLQASMEY